MRTGGQVDNGLWGLRWWLTFEVTEINHVCGFGWDDFGGLLDATHFALSWQKNAISEEQGRSPKKLFVPKKDGGIVFFRHMGGG